MVKLTSFLQSILTIYNQQDVNLKFIHLLQNMFLVEARLIAYSLWPQLLALRKKIYPTDPLSNNLLFLFDHEKVSFDSTNKLAVVIPSSCLSPTVFCPNHSKNSDLKTSIELQIDQKGKANKEDTDTSKNANVLDDGRSLARIPPSSQKLFWLCCLSGLALLLWPHIANGLSYVRQC